MHHPVIPDFSVARHNMVDRQLRPHGVSDPRVLAAMDTVPREIFVPSTHIGVAYLDIDVRLVANRYLLRPLLLAHLLQLASIKPSDRVLELAPATGYSTLVLAELSSSVASVEPDALLYKEAERNIASYAPGKAEVLAGAPTEGCITKAPFDVILINGAVETLPDFLLDQLDEGGRLVTVRRTRDPARTAHTGQVLLYRKTKGAITSTAAFEASTALVPGFAPQEQFVF